MVWCGVIKSIDENTLTCREALSMYDGDILFIPESSNEWIYSAISKIKRYYRYRISNGSTSVSNYHYDWALVRKLERLGLGDTSPIAFGDDPISIPTRAEREIANLEDYLMNLSDSFGVYYEPFLSSRDDDLDIKHTLAIDTGNPIQNVPLTIGNNTEAISNINIVEEFQQSTSLTVFDSTGTTIRGIYTVNNDGTIVDMPINSVNFTNDYMSYDMCRYKLVMSDDPIRTIAVENLGNAGFNHKITFDVDLNQGLYRFENFKLGRKVNFYYNDKLYKSRITAKKFSTEMDLMSVTLGNVRTKLTAKINIDKIKKKK